MALRCLKDCEVDEDIISQLKFVKELLNVQQEMPFVIGRILMELGRIYFALYRLEMGVVCLLEAELLSRQCGNFALTMLIIKELHLAYLSTDRMD
jgi:hypothetical protein